MRMITLSDFQLSVLVVMTIQKLQFGSLAAAFARARSYNVGTSLNFSVLANILLFYSYTPGPR